MRGRTAMGRRPQPDQEETFKYRGVRRRPLGRFSAEIWDPIKKTSVWLGAFGSAEDAARSYDLAARSLHGSKARTNFPVDTEIGYRCKGSDPSAARPASSSHSSTVESCSGHRSANRQVRPSPRPTVVDDCRSDCDSSSSVVDDRCPCRFVLPFDLNLPPPADDAVDLDDDVIRATALCL